MDKQSVDRIIQQIVEECYAELPQDWVGLWQIGDYIQNECPTAAWDMVRHISLEAVQRLLRDPRVHAGRPSTTVSRGFDAWPLTVQESLDRIAREWGALGRNPSIDEICWFDLS